MPWLSILAFIVSFLYQKSQRKSTAAAALTGAAIGLGTYYLADPSNPDNLFGIGVDSTGTAAPAASTVVTAGQSGGGVSDVLGKTVTTAGQVLTSWGSTGTAAVIGTTAVATSSSLKKYLPWILAIGAIWVLKSKGNDEYYRH